MVFIKLSEISTTPFRLCLCLLYHHRCKSFVKIRSLACLSPHYWTLPYSTIAMYLPSRITPIKLTCGGAYPTSISLSSQFSLSRIFNKVFHLSFTAWYDKVKIISKMCFQIHWQTYEHSNGSDLHSCWVCAFKSATVLSSCDLLST